MKWLQSKTQSITQSITQSTKIRFWGSVILKVAFYSFILFALLFMYHYNHVGDTTFIYNEF
ncbi:MAG: teichoic acid D-Ala incorporation-associated protein DltX [Clostridiales Family XIII bacterium]|nr:teichoic acid D-Ala incorporation-associated protein DltX [Clostridiales Family XIII bacterium]